MSQNDSMSRLSSVKGTSFEKFLPILVVITIALSFLVGVLWQKVANLEGGGGSTSGNSAGTAPAGTDPSAILGIDSLKSYAKELKLDANKFAECLDTDKYAQKVKDETSEGEGIGVAGTPAFFLNGLFISGAQPLKIFEDVIDFELAGGDWTSPSEAVAYLVDNNIQNGEISPNKINAPLGDAPSKGDENAPVTLIEYSDFECPFCGRFYSQTLQALETKYVDTGKVRMVYKQFPLISIHRNAQKAGEASLCAHEQGSFWEYHDLIFDMMSAS